MPKIQDYYTDVKPPIDTKLNNAIRNNLLNQSIKVCRETSRGEVRDLLNDIVIYLKREIKDAK